MKVSLGPLTRLEGHLNVWTDIEENTIVDARCAGEMFRGFEAILQGRDPLDAQQITQRICGVCPYAHAIASCYAQENAYGITPPPNGRILHNLIQGANHLYDYPLHFYQLAALDFIDITAVLEYGGADESLKRVKSWVQSEIGANKRFPAAPFLPRLSGQYVADKEVNIGALKHYLEALEIEQKANRASAIFGGKFPHATAIFPGGCSQSVTIDRIASYQSLIREVRDFIHGKYLPDLVAVAQGFPEYWDIGASKGGHLSFGLLPMTGEKEANRLFSSGVLLDGRLTDVDFGKITEEVRYSKYSSASTLRVHESELVPAPDKTDAYSWVKAPRYDGRVVEVGPAARVLVEYHRGRNETVKKLVDDLTASLGIVPQQLDSVLGRHVSRAICAVTIADFLLEQTEQLDPGQPAMAELAVPATGEGYGATEASRGALLHYIRLEDHRIAKYACVVPTTWNASPRDDQGRPGPIESALIGTKVVDPTQQIEAGRIVRSFDPCLACAVH